MLSNLHTHTVFCDGADTAEAMVLAAIDKGFSSIGFSGHGYTDFDLSYCIKDRSAYMSEIRRIAEKYGDKIKVYLGIEEDARAPVERKGLDYVIGSSHYSLKDGVYYSVDSSPEHFAKCLDAWGGDIVAFADEYYSTFCDYILEKRPNIIGHFDLITKYDELLGSRFLKSFEYQKLAEHYLRVALRANCIFEVNTGAIARGYRTSPYPYIDLLRVIKEEGGMITLSSDSHSTQTVDFWFDQAKALLRDVGFSKIMVLCDGIFTAIDT